MKCNHKSIKARELEEKLIQLLKEITPTEECLNLFVAFLYKAYRERNSRLLKMSNEADQEIERLKELRRTMVEKNLAGVYSDAIFKEQSDMIEDKITRTQIVKEGAKIDKYNIDAVTSFVKTHLADLGETYRRSSIGQLKVMISSVFATGVA